MKSLLLALALISAPAFAEHGLSLELERGVGYTYRTGKFWTGINFSTYQAQGAGLSDSDKQVVFSPRAFANLDIFEMSSIPAFLGLSWAETIGTKSGLQFKSRQVALPAGMRVRVVPNLEIAGWFNVIRINYSTGSSTSDYSETSKQYMSFGGVSGTYFF